ncbi:MULTISPECIES: sensor domain-containing diguanylate cyclase [Pseudomonas]|jgi:diguanylate cyclase (GGDEF)-like protein|uniref:sensor domain-containing diguanylate cyclase n=1 Tax=Pseudomonas TaxID=286 RepID=UPI000D993A35|nr:MULTISPECIES: sensor domain-containing diguanylate cyclase [Pseudomonas]MBD0678598.1 sensor domain-containing diguanylate cyclase [Pseudomonas sp. PSB11]MCK8682917.1 sensor domain-containing diguanylate cyclase [Pseudomonas umsongensis]MDP9688085.1 diguanylate cyclase (GGDEF)-like protein [Pseudomonas mohnii]
MKLTKRHHAFAGFILLALGLMGMSALLLLKSETQRRETRFAEYVQNISGIVRNQLDTNEAVLAGFSAFLQAVDQSDNEAAARYAAAVMSAYPHLYMLEAARAVPLAEQSAFEAMLRRTWRPDFTLKDFPTLTRQPARHQAFLRETWPVLFMYPVLAQANAIYGVRLETVDYLSYALARTYNNPKPVVSPVFTMYEGGDAFILMQSVSRPERVRESSRPNFFGSTMVALLLVRTGSLLDAVIHANVDPQVNIRAVLQTAAGTESHVFATGRGQAGFVDRFFLPLLEEQVEIHSASQPMTLLFERQLRLADVLSGQTLLLLVLLGASFILIPLLLIRHFKALERAEVEHQRSTYLATHDVLTDLPNRYLFADRFDQALTHWKLDRVAFAVLLIDLDHFKDINDHFGHEVGDQVLRALASRMLGATRTGDTVARYGGDEFVVLVTDLDDPENAEIKASKMLEAIGQSIITSAGEISLSCSIGIALCPLHGQTLDTLLKAADQAMYGVKQLGRKGIAMTKAL